VISNSHFQNNVWKHTNTAIGYTEIEVIKMNERLANESTPNVLEVRHINSERYKKYLLNEKEKFIDEILIPHILLLDEQFIEIKNKFYELFSTSSYVEKIINTQRELANFRNKLTDLTDDDLIKKLSGYLEKCDLLTEALLSEQSLLSQQCYEKLLLPLGDVLWNIKYLLQTEIYRLQKKWPEITRNYTEEIPDLPIKILDLIYWHGLKYCKDKKDALAYITRFELLSKRHYEVSQRDYYKIYKRAFLDTTLFDRAIAQHFSFFKATQAPSFAIELFFRHPNFSPDLYVIVDTYNKPLINNKNGKFICFRKYEFERNPSACLNSVKTSFPVSLAIPAWQTFQAISITMLALVQKNISGAKALINRGAKLSSISYLISVCRSTGLSEAHPIINIKPDGIFFLQKILEIDDVIMIPLLKTLSSDKKLLEQAVTTKAKNIVNALYDHCVDDDMKDSFFYAAAGNGHLKIIEYFLKDKNVNVNMKCPMTGRTSLSYAANGGECDAAKLLLSNGAKFSIDPAVNDLPPIEVQEAISSWDFNTIVAVFEGYLNTQEKKDEVINNTVSYLFLCLNRLYVYRFELSNSTNKNLSLNTYNTHDPFTDETVKIFNYFYDISTLGPWEILRQISSLYLIDAVKIFFMNDDKYFKLFNEVDESGNTVMHYLVHFLSEENISSLVKKQAHLLLKPNTSGQLPIHSLCSHFNESPLEYIKYKKTMSLKELSHFNEFNSMLMTRDNFGKLPSHYLLDAKEYPPRSIYTEIGLTEKDGYGYTPLHYAVKKMRTQDFIRIIENFKTIDINVTADDGMSLLHMAVIRGSHDLVNYLLNQIDVDVNIADKKGKKAIDYASKESEIYHLLEAKKQFCI
jgi:ankyrin repeat protein